MHVPKVRFSDSMESRASQRNLSAASLTRASILKTHAAGFTNVGRDRSPQSDLLASSTNGRSHPRDLQLVIHIDARASRQSSIFLRRIVRVMFMGVNSKCAHQVRPPPARSEASGCR